MITLHPPAGTKPGSAIKLHSGTTVFPDRTAHHVRVQDENDAADLEARGWQRDIASTKMAAWRSDMLRKSVDAQSRHTLGAGDSSRRRELGEIEVELGAEQRRIRVSHDPADGVLNLHGVMVRSAELDPDLASAVEASAAALNEVQGREEQATQRVLLGALLDRVLRRHEFVADALVRRLDNERFAV